jgi:hypothetical protein
MGKVKIIQNKTKIMALNGDVKIIKTKQNILDKIYV